VLISIFLNIFRVLSKYYFYSFEFRLRFTSKGKKGPSDGFNFRAISYYDIANNSIDRYLRMYTVGYPTHESGCNPIS